MTPLHRCSILAAMVALVSFVAHSDRLQAQVVFPSGTAFDLGAAPGDAETIDVSGFNDLGSIFWDVDSADMDSQVNDETAPPFGDVDLRDDLPAFITAGPGADYTGVSGGWNYQRILPDSGGTDFLGGVATTDAPGGEVVNFTIGAGAPQDMQFNLVIDILDGTVFVPSSLTVAAGVSTATVETTNVNQNGDVYSFDVLGLSEGDTVSISLGAAGSVNTIAGVLLGDAEPFQLEFEIDRGTGVGTILHNTTGSDIELKGYSLSSAGGSLSPTGWNSLQDQGQADQGAGAGNTDPTDGIGWEELADGGDANFLGEFNLQSSTILGSGGDDSLGLGSVFGFGGDEDIAITYSLADGREVTFDATFVGTATLPGDFNNDGVVDGDDLTDAGDGFNDRFGDDLFGEDLLLWQRNFGAGGGSEASAAAVPEPSSIALVLLVCVAFLPILIRRTLTPITLAIAVFCLPLARQADAGFTLDRDYQLGDDPAENATAGAAVGSFSFDSAGEPNQGQFVDLRQFEGPTYVSVDGRPLGGTGLGIEFDGADDFLEGERFGLPATSFSAIGGVNLGTLDYSGIADRGIQFWVRPDSSGQGATQSVVNDTNQHGVAISSNDTWVMRYGGTEFDSGVSAAFDAWSHVMLVRPSGAANGARMYVDGVAVAAIPGGYDGANEFPLVLGANTGDPLGDPEQLSGTSEFFAGAIDNLEMFVLGVSNDTSTDYGTFQFDTDNEFAADALSGYVPGDATGDGLVMGDGSGGPDDDVAVFLANWRASNDLNGVATPDINSPAMADFNFDGSTGLLDWDILVAGHPNGSSLNLAALLSTTVPEPSSIALAAFMIGGLLASSRRRLAKRSTVTAAFACTALLSLGEAKAQVSFVGVVPDTGGDVRASATLTGPNAGLTYDGSLFFDVDSPDQNDRTNNPDAGNPFGDDELRDNLPAYITAGPGSEYVGVSGGWGYQQVMDDFGAPFESGGATINAGPPGNILDFTVGAGAPSDLLITVLTDHVDGAQFVPSAITVRSNGAVATAASQTPNLNSDLYYFLVEGVSASDLIEIDVADGGSTAVVAGVQFGDGSAFTPLFDPDPILTIDRTTGSMVLSNGTGAPLDFRAYEIESLAGALNPDAWNSIADTYDSDNDGSVDPDSTWLEFTPSTDRDNLAEGQQPGTGVSLANEASIDLGTAWLQSPTEDVSMQLLMTDGALRDVQVLFEGNNGGPLALADLNGDGAINIVDWNVLKPLVNGDLSDLSPVEKYLAGDLTADDVVDLGDARAFAAAFDAANGAGSFAAALAAVPEPSTGALLLVTMIALASYARRSYAR